MLFRVALFISQRSADDRFFNLPQSFTFYPTFSQIKLRIRLPFSLLGCWIIIGMFLLHMCIIRRSVYIVLNIWQIPLQYLIQIKLDKSKHCSAMYFKSNNTFSTNKKVYENSHFKSLQLIFDTWYYSFMLYRCSQKYYLSLHILYPDTYTKNFCGICASLGNETAAQFLHIQMLFLFPRKNVGVHMAAIRNTQKEGWICNDEYFTSNY